MAIEAERKKTPRCHRCKKKIALMMRGTPCHCGYEFCSAHRLPETHECSFDHRAKHLSTSSDKITAMKCVADKVKKI